MCLVIRREWQFVAIVSCFLVISPWARVGLFPDNELGDRNHLAYVDGIAIGCCTALAAHRLRVPGFSAPWLPTGRPTSHVSLGWLSAIGRLSYEVYLTHMFVVLGCVAVHARSSRTDVATYSLYAIAIVLSWALAEVVARTVSNPAHRWLRARIVGTVPKAVPWNRVS